MSACLPPPCAAANLHPFSPSGVITLTTDFGHQDPFVGVMKGQVLRRFAGARLVDLTHEVRVHWPAEAGFWLGRSFRYFPTGTVHVAVVDPGVGSARDIAVVEAEGQVFLAPDNGLLAGVLERLDDGPRSCAAWTRPSCRPWASTARARRSMAATSSRRSPPSSRPGASSPLPWAPSVTELVPGWLDEPTVAPGQVSGAVVTIDHFGNLLTNIDASLLSPISHPVVRAGGHEIPLRRTYADVRPGDYLALVNSFGVLEVARAEQSAAAGLGSRPGGPGGRPVPPRHLSTGPACRGARPRRTPGRTTGLTVRSVSRVRSLHRNTNRLRCGPIRV